MSGEDGEAGERLRGIVEAVADGREVDWAAVERDAKDDEEREQLRALRAVERVGREFSTWHSTADGTAGPGNAPDDPGLAPGTRWGELEILERIGRGSFGDVYRARDPHLDRIVALKLIRRLPRGTEETGNSEGQESRERRAVREGQLLARIRHENVVTVFGAARHEGRVGIWMEYLEGKTLADLLREQGPSSAREAAGIGIDLCRALAAVHAEGILHRDVKAQNVMRAARGRIVLTDFGIGRELSESGGASLSGTPLYLAPEVLAGGEATVASDLYALGVLLYHLTTGDFPVRGDTLAVLRRLHEGGSPRLLRDARPDLPSGFAEIAERLLAREPKERFASAGEVERALRGWASGDGEGSAPRRLRSWKRFLFRIALIGLVVAIGLALALAISPWLRAREFYLQSKVEQELGATDKALGSLERATELDSGYALAWVRKATLLGGIGMLDQALIAERRAFELQDRLAPAEKHTFLGLYHVNRMQYAEAIEEYQKAVDFNPADAPSWRELALAHANLGEYEKALIGAQEAVRRDPKNTWSSGLEAIFLAALGRPQEALASIQAARTRLGDETYFYWGEGLAHAYSGEYKAAESDFGRMAESGEPLYGPYGRILGAQVLILEGDLEGARKSLEAALGADLRAKNVRNEAVARVQLARLALIKGDRGEARTQVKILERGLVDVPIQLKYLRETALLALDAEAADAAERLAVRIGRIVSADPSDLGRAFVLQVRGEIELQRGQIRPAREALQEAYRYRPDLSVGSSLAKAWIAEGACHRASERLVEIVHAKGRALREYQAQLWLQSNLELARCKERMGRTDEAQEIYDTFLRSWGRTATPLAIEAQKERARFQK